MKTISIRVVQVKGGIRAYINTACDGIIYASDIAEPYSDAPYYILDGKRHDLTDHQKKLLREVIAEVRGR